MKKKTLLLALAAFSLSLSATVKPFTPGSLIVYRVGDGTTTTLNATAAPIFLDEYSLDGPSPQLIQSIPMPTEAAGANKRMVINGNSTWEGYMTRSYDGRYLVVPGFDGALGSNVAKQSGASVPRVAALVDYQGNINSSTSFKLFDKDDYRCATSSDGSDIYASGGGSGGTCYMPTGDGSAPITLGTDNGGTVNTRCVRIFGNQLFTQRQEVLYKVGNGIPKTEGNSLVQMQEYNVNPSGENLKLTAFDFFMIDTDPTNPGTKVVMYQTALSSTGGLLKFSLKDGVFVYNGKADIAATPNNSRTLEGMIDSYDNSVILFVVESSGDASTVWQVSEKGEYDKPFVILGEKKKILSTVGTDKKVIRSVAMAPVRDAVGGNSTNQETENTKIFVSNDNIIVELAVNKDIRIFSPEGILLKVVKGELGRNTIEGFSSGCYVVSTDTKSEVIIK